MTAETMADSKKRVDTFQRRFKRWRQRYGQTLDDITTAVNEHLPKVEQLARSTVGNYEGPSSPRVEWIAALQKAYPTLNTEWLVHGIGDMDRPTKGPGKGLGELLKMMADPRRHEMEQRFELDKLPLHLRDRLVDLMRAASSRLSYKETSEARITDENDAMASKTAGVIAAMYRMPFGSPGFVAMNELSDEELETYTYAYVAAMRPLLTSLRS